MDRGPSSYLSNVDLYLDGRLITSVQGDGEWGTSADARKAPECSRLPFCRPDRVHAHGEHGVRSRGGSVHDPPQRPRHHGHAHLPPLALVQAHRGAGWRGAHGRMAVWNGVGKMIFNQERKDL